MAFLSALSAGLMKNGAPLTRTEALALLPGRSARLLDLMAAARLTASAKSPAFFTCGIINVKSGLCGENCRFCSQSKYHGARAPVYPLMGDEEILRRAEGLAAIGVTYLGLVSSGGRPAPWDLARLAALARALTERLGLKLCASLGLISYEQALSLKQAGFTGYHHNLETAPSFYPLVCDSHSFNDRWITAQNVQRAGLRLCSGGLFGLGESWEQRLELAEALARLAPDSIPLNFLRPIKGTPLENAPPLPPWEALAIIAFMRLMNPETDLVVCGGRGEALGDWEKLIFPAGANGLMIGDYLTTKGRSLAGDRELLTVWGAPQALKSVKN